MEVTTLLDDYLAGPAQLRSGVAGLSREHMLSRPIAGRWSVLEVICHLVDTDANISHRLKRVLSEERPVFDRVKPELMLAALAYHERDVEEELALFDLGRRQIVRILKASPPDAWERVGIIGDRGDRTVAQMVNGAVEHLAHHLKFVIEKRGALLFADTARAAEEILARLKPETARNDSGGPPTREQSDENDQDR